MSSQQTKTRRGAWVQALKIWNKSRGDGRWIVPRKGTAEHAEVKKIMDEGLRKGGFIGPLLGGLASVFLPSLLQ